MALKSDKIIIRGLTQNNLKNVSLDLEKGKIIVFTGVSGSGKSSIVFDTIAAESGRRISETYPAFIRNRMPKHERPHAEKIANLSPAIVVDQSRPTGNIRSTVGTTTDLYTGLRVLFSRIGEPYAGPASAFSFNDISGMCRTCSGLGNVSDINIAAILDENRSLNSGCILDSTFRPGSWYWKQYTKSGLFDANKPLCEYSAEERNLLLYGSKAGKGGILENPKIEGLYNQYARLYLRRDTSSLREHQRDKAESIIISRVCPDCLGRRLNRKSLGCWINGKNIADVCEMELSGVVEFLDSVADARADTLVSALKDGVKRIIDIGLSYLNLNRESATLSGGEAQRIKLVRYIGNSLTGMMYIFDEPSTGMHPRDVHRMNDMLLQLRDSGNTVLVVEHDRDVISIADEIVDVGPGAGVHGGEIVFQGTYDELLKADTLTGRAMRSAAGIKTAFRKPSGFLPLRGVNLNNMKNTDADIPLGILTVVTGVAGSGKSTLVSKAFSSVYRNRVVTIDQGPITATGRSTPASYLGFFDKIRNLFAEANGVDASMFSFNSEGGCKACGGKGVVVTELVFMDPVAVECEECGGTRYSAEALGFKYKGKNIVQVLAMTAEEAYEFFEDESLRRSLYTMIRVGIAYMPIGQTLSTLSGGERQRVKLAKNLDRRGGIYVMDEPTTGLHPSDVGKLLDLFDSLVDSGNTVVVIEHNTDVVKHADYIIDVGPDGGNAGGKIVFTGTPAEMVAASNTITAQFLRASLSSRSAVADEPSLLKSITQNNEKIVSSEPDIGRSPACEVKKRAVPAKMHLEPIGRIEQSEDDTHIVLSGRWAEALNGIEGFSHVQIIWWFDGCDNETDRSRTVEPRPYNGGPDQLGVFATRSPRRPNPVAVTTSAITWTDVDKGLLGIAFIDAMDGTPVLDIKPYTPSLDRVENPSVPEWSAGWPGCLEKSADFDWDKVFTDTDENNA